MTYEVRDGSRILQFSGRLLAESSSWRRHSYRWIEFQLYKTENGSYVLSRVGLSLIYHGAACSLIDRYGLSEVPWKSLGKDAVPCEECDPDESAALVFPEKDRYWAQVSEEPSAVLDALYKVDDSGARYLTYVAQRLLDEAAEVDTGIAAVYKVELIP
jgi:hypothetical protein